MKGHVLILLALLMILFSGTASAVSPGSKKFLPKLFKLFKARGDDMADMESEMTEPAETVTMMSSEREPATMKEPTEPTKPMESMMEPMMEQMEHTKEGDREMEPATVEMESVPKERNRNRFFVHYYRMVPVPFHGGVIYVHHPIYDEEHVPSEIEEDRNVIE